MTLKNTLIILLVIFFSSGVYYIYLNKDSLISSSQSRTTLNSGDKSLEINDLKIVNEIDNYKLPGGEQVYNISHGDEVKGPRAEKISYNPLSISPGVEQIITVTFPKDEIVNSGVVFITTDNIEKQKVTLQKTNDSSNIWSGKWTASDSINKRYSIILYFLGPKGTYNTTTSFI